VEVVVRRILFVLALVAMCAATAPAQRGGMRGGGPGGPGGGGPRGGGFGNAPRAGSVTVAPRGFGHPGGFTPNVFGSTHGFGNVVFPGTGHPPNTFVPFGDNLGFAGRLSNTVSGFNNLGGRVRGRAVFVPYAVPYYVPYAEPQPPVTIVTPPPQIIYVVPGEPDRTVATGPPEPRRESVITYVVPTREPTAAAAVPAQKLYLIALTNHSIYTATDYWVEDGTLHYLTSFGAHNQASLDQVDLEFTERLNRERGLEFRLDK
jgi:hypothetical protein